MSEDVRTRSQLDYYARPAPMTTIGDHATGERSSDVAELCRTIQGWLMHPFHAFRYDVRVADDGERQLQNRSVREILAEVLAQGDAPLSEPRAPERRAIGNCRHFATLLTGLLRERGVPARARCGFGAYFEPEKKADHWVCEWWDDARGRWVLADAQVDDVQRQGMGIEINTLDLGREDFWVAGQAWQRCRSGDADPEDFGILDMWGLWFIRGNLVRDLAALCKVELLPWDAWGIMQTDSAEQTELELELLDRVAALTADPVPDVALLRDLYEKREELRVPATIVSYRPEPGTVDLGELATG